eukprot:2431965-Rhodomonas_salina.3
MVDTTRFPCSESSSDTDTNLVPIQYHRKSYRVVEFLRKRSAIYFAEAFCALGRVGTLLLVLAFSASLAVTLTRTYTHYLEQILPCHWPRRAAADVAFQPPYVFFGGVTQGSRRDGVASTCEMQTHCVENAMISTSHFLTKWESPRSNKSDLREWAEWVADRDHPIRDEDERKVFVHGGCGRQGLVREHPHHAQQSEAGSPGRRTPEGPRRKRKNKRNTGSCFVALLSFGNISWSWQGTCSVLAASPCVMSMPTFINV